MVRIVSLSVFLAVFILNSALFAADWTSFRGTHRDGKSTETGLLKSWPAEGPKLLWSVNTLGSGWSSATIANGRVYCTGMDKKSKEGILCAWDTQGKPLWEVKYGPEWTGNFPGVRTTPTFSDNKLYIHSGNGLLSCFDAISGDPVWQVNTAKDYDLQKQTWGVSESVLVVGDLAICSPGGTKAALAAFNKTTGRPVWACPVEGQKTAYCAPVYAAHARKPQVVELLETDVVGVDIASGALLWRLPCDGTGINPVSPIYQDGQIFVTSGYDDYGVLLQLNEEGTGVTEVWRCPEFDTHHGGVLVHDGHIYGTSWIGNGNGHWLCVDWKTGKLTYDATWDNKGSIIYADGMLYCYNEKTGKVALVPAHPEKFEVVSEFKITRGSGQHWAHPAIADGVLYIRHGECLMAYDIKAR